MQRQPTYRQHNYRYTNHLNVHTQCRGRLAAETNLRRDDCAEEVSRETWPDYGCATTRACAHRTDSRRPIHSTCPTRANSRSQSRKSKPERSTDCERSYLRQPPDGRLIKKRAFAETQCEHTESCRGQVDRCRTHSMADHRCMAQQIPQAREFSRSTVVDTAPIGCHNNQNYCGLAMIRVLPTSRTVIGSDKRFRTTSHTSVRDEALLLERYAYRTATAGPRLPRALTNNQAVRRVTTLTLQRRARVRKTKAGALTPPDSKV